MITTTDQLHRSITLNKSPSRIISLVPSQTELLFDLGLSDEVIGITKFCVHPEKWFRTKTRVGGTKNLNIDKIKSLQPDLIIANKEENSKEDIQLLINQFPVWVSDIKNLDDSISMIRGISGIINKRAEGEKLIENILSAFNHLENEVQKKISCAYLIWKDPLMTIGGDTFISNMLKHAGFTNVFADKIRYPEIKPEDIRKMRPEVILLSSEPYPFKEKNLREFEADFPSAKVLLVDGELFSWYGSRLLKSPAYFLKLRAIIKSAL